MIKKIKIKNSILLFIGILLILIGIFFVCFRYFESKKNQAFLDMNILLYENEVPKTINVEEDNDDSIGGNEISQISEVPEEKPQNATIQYNYIGILEIPKIDVKSGFLDLNSKYNNVDYNITVIKGSSFPDVQNGNLILASHSGVCYVCYFNKLYKLSQDDVAYVYYNGLKYEYKVVNIYEVEKTGKVSIHRNMNVNSLTLITCTRNSDTKQTVYILELYNKEAY